MDRVFAEGMRLFGRIGVFEEERKNGQFYLVDVSLEVCLKASGSSDALSDTIDYGAVFRIAKELMDASECMLLERYAELLAGALFGAFPSAQSARIAVRKPDAPVDGDFESMGVEIARSRNG